MTDTLWADVSQYNAPVDDTYPYRWISIRSNDGTYRDLKFNRDYAWARAAADAGRLDGFLVYAVYEPDDEAWESTLISNLGAPHPKMAVMIDVESWSGRIGGDQSADINSGRSRLTAWLGDSRRVLGYGNEADLRTLWPDRGDTQLVVAAYGFNPQFPGKIAHQYTDHGAVAPFGFADMNSADGLSSAQLAQALGLTGQPASVGAPEPVHTPATPGEEDDTMTPNTGIYWDVDAKTVAYAVLNTMSGYWQPFGNGTGNGPLPQEYVNGVDAAFKTGNFAKVTAGHAAAIQHACESVLQRTLSGDVTATVQTAAAS